MDDVQIFLANLGNTDLAKMGSRGGLTHTLAARLKAARLAKRWSCSEVARRSGVCVNTVIRAERGMSATSTTKIEKIREALGLAK